MSEMLAVRLEHERVRAMAEVVEAWKREHDEARRSRDVEDLVQSTLRTSEAMGVLVQSCLNRAGAGTIEDVDATWQSLVESLDTCALMMQEVHQIAEGLSLEAAGTPISDLPSLEKAIVDIQRLANETYDAWPFDEAKLREAQDNARKTLPHDRLLKLAEKYPPPQSWYDEDSRPS